MEKTGQKPQIFLILYETCMFLLKFAAVCLNQMQVYSAY